MTEPVIHRVTPRTAKRLLTKVMAAGLVPFIQSSPGMGKSSIFKQIAKEFRLKLIDHRMSTSEPTDMTGLPRFTADGRAEFVPFRGLFPLTDDPIPDGFDGWMLFLDEWNAASKQVQAANRRTNVYVTINGRTETVSEWCRHYGISRFTVNTRVRSGMPVVEAITKPLERKKRAKEEV